MNPNKILTKTEAQTLAEMVTAALKLDPRGYLEFSVAGAYDINVHIDGDVSIFECSLDYENRRSEWYETFQDFYEAYEL